MHVAKTIGAFLDRHLQCGHRQRFRAVVDAVVGLVRGGKASLTSIGRNMVVAVAPKHAIKRVDRSDLGHGLSVLRAAVAVPGRALPIYEEVHPSSKEGNRRVHQRFLENLKWVTRGRSPILVADAGFRTPFFRACSTTGFDFVIRLRGDGLVRFSSKPIPFTTL